MAGDFGLAASYWLFGVFGGLLFRLITWAIGEPSERPVIAMVWSLIHLAYVIPVMIGIWNAAGRYEGRKVWAVAARIVVVVNSVSMVAKMATPLVTLVLA